MMDIPQRLQNEQYRFIILNGKRPTEKNWQETANYPHNHPKLQRHIQNEGNYGVLCGINKLVVLDFDSKKAIDEFYDKLTPTFTTKTGSDKYHLYYEIEIPETHQINQDGIKIDIQGPKRQVVGPGSTHPITKKKYRVERDLPIATITKETIQELLQQKEPKEEPHTYQGTLTLKQVAHELGLNLKEGIQKCCFHNDKNPSLSVDFSNNVFKCHASTCQAQGGIRSLVMHAKGIDETRAQTFLNALDRQTEATREGLVKKAVGETIARNAITNGISLKKLMEEGLPEIEWRVQDLLPKRGLTMLAAPAGQRKTYIAQHLALAISQGLPFLNAFETEQTNVLYIDEENGVHLLHRRFCQISKGHEVNDHENLHLFVFEGIKLDIPEGKSMLKTLVEHYDAGFVVIDSMVRFMQGDENSAKDVRNVFDNIKGVMEDRNLAILILHHMRKEDSRGMNSLRGSGDFSAMCDVVLTMKSKAGGEMVFEMEKNRWIDTSDVRAFTVAVTHPGGDKDQSVRFTHTGKHVVPEEMKVVDHAVERILHWIDKSGVDKVHTSVIRPYLKKELISQRGIYAGLTKLTTDGVLMKLTRGVYKVNHSAFVDAKRELIPPKKERNGINGTSGTLSSVRSTPYRVEQMELTGINEPEQTQKIRDYINQAPKQKRPTDQVIQEFPNINIAKLVEQGDLYESEPGQLKVNQ